MIAAAPPPLTPRERLAIAAGIGVLVLAVRVSVTLAAALIFGSQPHDELVGIAGMTGMLVPLPLGVAWIEKILARDKRRWWIDAGVLVIYGAFAAVIALTSFFAAVPIPDFDVVRDAVRTLFPPMAAASALLLSIAIGVVSAIQRYRMAIEADAKRAELEAASARKARQAIEEQMRPGLVIATLENVAERLDADDAKAEAALLRLARYERSLLQTLWTAAASRRFESGSEPPQSTASNEMPQWSTSYAEALALYFAVSILMDVRFIDWQGPWNLAVMTMLSAVLWLGAGPLLNRVVKNAVRLRFTAAISLAMACTVIATAIVTAASVLLLRTQVTAAEFAASHTFLSFLTWRNMLAASAIGAGSFAAGYARVMFEARAEAARALEQTLHAEARELEARFHPHFLFNALSSIAALIRSDRTAAAEMCRRLAGLVSKTVARAGVEAWPLHDELDLVRDYLYVQAIRFGDRLNIVHWDIQAATRADSIPRLMLQPLIENIFKHAVAGSKRTTDAGLSVFRRGERIQLELWNSIDRSFPTLEYGRGMSFVARRVRAVGGEMAIDVLPGRFIVRCSIPVKKRMEHPARRAAGPSGPNTHIVHAAAADHLG